MSDSRVFLITGASTGIGAATARHAVEAGYKVVLAARSEDKLQALAGELGGDDVALAMACDVTDFAQQEAVVAAALERWGRLDVAFANAGFGAARGLPRGDARALARHGPHQRPRRRVHDPRDAAGLKETQGPPAADRLGGRAPRDPRQPLLLDEVGGHRRWASRCARSSTAPACGRR